MLFKQQFDTYVYRLTVKLRCNFRILFRAYIFFNTQRKAYMLVSAVIIQRKPVISSSKIGFGKPNLLYNARFISKIAFKSSIHYLYRIYPFTVCCRCNTNLICFPSIVIIPSRCIRLNSRDTALLSAQINCASFSRVKGIVKT